jgi:hypothetical protein
LLAEGHEHRVGSHHEQVDLDLVLGTALDFLRVSSMASGE